MTKLQAAYLLSKLSVRATGVSECVDRDDIETVLRAYLKGVEDGLPWQFQILVIHPSGFGDGQFLVNFRNNGSN